MEKLCKKCGESKPVEDFYRNKASKDGWRHECKKCSIAAARQWNLENKDRYLENQARYSSSETGKATRKAHREGPARERVLEQKRESWDRHRDANCERQRTKWRENGYQEKRLSRYMSDPEYREKVKAQARAWRAENSLHLRNKMLQRNFGLTLEDFDAMLVAQNGCCAICAADITGVEESGRMKGRVKAHVDHCHDSGKVRALLCTNCNKAIGLMQDNPQRLRSAAEYVERYLIM